MPKKQKATEWLGGKQVGTVFQRRNQKNWTAVLTLKKSDTDNEDSKKDKKVSKVFKTEQDGWDFIEKQIKEYNIYKKNRYRIVDGKYMIVQLSKNYVMLTDLDYKDAIDKYPLFVARSGSKNAKNYASMMVGKKQVPFHQFILGTTYGDHLDRHPLDNRRENLRHSNHTINMANRTSDRGELVGIRLVDCHSNHRDFPNVGYWEARIKCDGTEISSRYSNKEYGCEKAKRMAINWRKKAIEGTYILSGELRDRPKELNDEFISIMTKYSDGFLWDQRNTDNIDNTDDIKELENSHNKKKSSKESETKEFIKKKGQEMKIEKTQLNVPKTSKPKVSRTVDISGDSRRKQHIVEDDIEKKECNKCLKNKELNQFNKNPAVWDNLDRTCRECKAEYRRLNSEKIREKKKQYREANKDKLAEWKQQNKEKIKEYNKKYREENSEKVKQLNKEWYEKNGEQVKEKRKKERVTATKPKK